MTSADKVKALVESGADIPCPDTVFIAPETDIARISGSVTIYPGCRIQGSETAVGPGCSIGSDGPVTLRDSQLDENVTLKSGVFDGAVMLAGSDFGPGAQVRPATIIEEQASCAHAVGLKQTVLFPFVTLGSLINFCDCFMSGGTSRKNHSEVGSSYIHFNYTPHQDKATASLAGDVPRGVMLNQRPIFLGGQGGLVGPSIIEYGAITAAGTICRKDIREAGKLVYEKTLPARRELPYQPGAYGDISRIIKNNMTYIGNLYAMRAWYMKVRSLFIGKGYSRYCHDGALRNIELLIDERLKRMSQLAGNMPRSLEIALERLGVEPSEPPFDKQISLHAEWPELEERLRTEDFDTDIDKRDKFLKLMSGPSYIEAIQSLSPKSSQTGTDWLQAIVDRVTGTWKH